MEWQQHESTVRPLEVDDTMSKIYVYLRKNITSEERTDEQTGITTTWYVYEETVVPKEEYYDIAACQESLKEQTDANTESITGLEDMILEMSEIIYA